LGETLEQNTTEWLEYRKQGLGGSDLPILMGDSPYMTPYQLWRQKTGFDETKDEPNFVQAKGHELEVIARNKYEIETGLEWKPRLAIHAGFSHFRASLDGFNDDKNAVWECKYIGKDGFEEIKNGVVPCKYRAQVQWQMFVTGAIENHLTAINDEHEIVTTIVKPDFDYMKKIALKAQEFWDCVQEKRPPEMTAKDKVEIKSHTLRNILIMYDMKEDQMKKLKEELDALKKEVFERIPHTNCYIDLFGSRVSVQVQERQGTVDWKKVVKDFDIDQEKYRKKPTKVNIIKINRVGENNGKTKKTKN